MVEIIGNLIKELSMAERQLKGSVSLFGAAGLSEEPFLVVRAFEQANAALIKAILIAVKLDYLKGEVKISGGVKEKPSHGNFLRIFFENAQNYNLTAEEISILKEFIEKGKIVKRGEFEFIKNDVIAVVAPDMDVSELIVEEVGKDIVLVKKVIESVDKELKSFIKDRRKI